MSVILKTALWMFLFYLVTFAAVFVIEYSAQRYDSLYILRDYPRSIYATDNVFAVYGLDRIDRNRKQVFILGASVPGFAFLPDRLMSNIPGYQVNNLCLQAANVTEMEQMLDLIERQLQISSLDRPIFVIGGHFVSFLDNNREFRGKITRIQQEFIRFGLYRVDGEFVRPRFGDARTTAVLTFFLKPFMLIYKIKLLVLEGFKNFMKAYFLKPPRPNPTIYRRYREMAFKRKGFTNEQFAELDRLIQRLEGQNAEVIFVHLPVPSYYRNHFYIYDDYRRRTEYLSHRKDISVLDMSDRAADDNFVDDAHPVDSVRDVWSDWLARFIGQTALAEAKGRSVPLSQQDRQGTLPWRLAPGFRSAEAER